MAYVSEETMKRLLRPSEDPTPGKVYPTKALLIVGIICAAFGFITAVVAAVIDSSPWVILALVLFGIFSSILIVAFINCRIRYNANGFTAKSFFGITRTYTYDQVTSIKENRSETFIRVGDRSVMIDATYVGGKEFITFVKQQYSTLHDGEPLPETKTVWYDIFNGNLTDPLGYVIACVLLSVFAVGFLIFSVVFTWFSPSTVDNTIKQTVQFVSYGMSDNDIVMFTADHTEYRIRFTDEEFETDKILRLFDTGRRLTVYSKEESYRRRESCLSVKAIKSNGRYVLSFEETNRLREQEYRYLVWVTLGFCLFVGVYITGSVIIGRNPKKYNRWVIRLFFQKKHLKTEEETDSSGGECR